MSLDPREDEKVDVMMIEDGAAAVPALNDIPLKETKDPFQAAIDAATIPVGGIKLSPEEYKIVSIQGLTRRGVN
jgi:hypothetical protein